MKSTRITALAALGVAVTLSLTACDDGSTTNSSAKDTSSSASTSSSSSSTSSPPSSGGGSEAEAGSGTGDAQPGSGEDIGAGADGGSDATPDGGQVAFCKTEDLAVDARDAAPDEASGRIDITMINRGPTTCSATGFPGVDIKDEDNTSNPIERGPAQPRVTVLEPDDAAVFDLAYDIDASGENLASPTNLLVTPPNETHTVTLDWPAGAGAIKGAYTDVQVYPTHTTE